MGKSIRSNAAKHKRTKKRERVQGHYDAQLEARVARAREALARAQPVRPHIADAEDAGADANMAMAVGDDAPAAPAAASSLRRAKREKKKGMQWEAMLPTPRDAMDTSMDTAMDASGIACHRSARRTSSGDGGKRAAQGGKLLGVFKKTTKKQRKKLKKKEKRKQQK
mmetsp:Transcript_5154/g.13444  ORF Transcript_5154/g.13444 Transcript_5154/m.13444 type:complete len:167 (+) Transcript_5154:513-1013(+)